MPISFRSLCSRLARPSLWLYGVWFGLLLTVNIRHPLPDSLYWSLWAAPQLFLWVNILHKLLMLPVLGLLIVLMRFAYAHGYYETGEWLSAFGDWYIGAERLEDWEKQYGENNNHDVD